MVRLPAHRLIAALLALLVTAAVVVMVLRATGAQRSSGPSGAALAAQNDPFCGPGLLRGLGEPANPAHRGSYANVPYRYAVTIPEGLTGYTRAGAAPRGFTILLSDAGDLRVDAAYDALYDITAAGVHTRDAMDVRLLDRLVADQAEPYVLAGLAGGRYRMQVLCPGSGMVHVFDDVIVVRNREIYRVELQTTPRRIAQDEALLQQLLASWRWLP
jgi:hypothetical protein